MVLLAGLLVGCGSGQEPAWGQFGVPVSKDPEIPKLNISVRVVDCSQTQMYMGEQGPRRLANVMTENLGDATAKFHLEMNGEKLKPETLEPGRFNQGAYPMPLKYGNSEGACQALRFTVVPDPA